MTAENNFPRNLLLVDDEPNILSALKRTLRKNSYTIFTAASGKEGLDLLANHEIGVIISDQRMPQMTGVEFLRKVKVLYPKTVRIVLSGYTEIETVTSAINEGAIYKFLSNLNPASPKKKPAIPTFLYSIFFKNSPMRFYSYIYRI